jgi:hypothetical protein
MAIHVGQYPELADEKWVRTKYLDEGLSCPQIAALLGCTPGAVEARLRTYGVTMRGRWYGSWASRACERCGEEYTPSGPAQKFCSQKCLRGTATCRHCGEEFLKSPANPKNEFCSRKHYWEHTKANGKQGRYVRKDGYVRVQVPDGTPGKQRDGRMPEHRYVMQEHLGRPIRADEDVHHINGVKDDNRLENLELWSGSQPRGQRVVDKVTWAREILAIYEDEIAAGLI